MYIYTIYTIKHSTDSQQATSMYVVMEITIVLIMILVLDVGHNLI